MFIIVMIVFSWSFQYVFHIFQSCFACNLLVPIHLGCKEVDAKGATSIKRYKMHKLKYLPIVGASLKLDAHDDLVCL